MAVAAALAVSHHGTQVVVMAAGTNVSWAAGCAGHGGMGNCVTAEHMHCAKAC